MAKSYIVISHCDFCILEDSTRKVDAEYSETISMAGQEAKEIDACKPCKERFLEPLRRVLQTMGRETDEPRQSRPKRGVARGSWGGLAKDGRTCFLCDHEVGTGPGLDAHTQARHGLSSMTLFGRRCPICDAELKSGLGIHTIRRHHKMIEDVFREAEKAGDEYGHVAAARKRAEIAEKQLKEYREARLIGA